VCGEGKLPLNFTKFLQRLSLLICAISLGACATHLQFKSIPEKARVDLISNQHQTPMFLGETPLTMTNHDITEKQFSGPYVLRFSKDGYLTKDVVFGSLTGLEIDMNIELKASAFSTTTNKLIDGLFEAQNLAQKRDYDACLAKLDILQSEHPDVVAIYEMRGSIFMMQGKYEVAKKEISRA